MGVRGNVTEQMRWQGPWQPGREYDAFDVVPDEQWTMIANKQTFDKPAPQPSGDPAFVSGLGDTPSWTSDQDTEKQIIFGQRYSVAESGYVTGFRLWVPVVNSLITYELISVGDPLGTPTFDVVVPEFVPTATGWLESTGHLQLVGAGVTFDLIAVVVSHTGESTFNHDWDYQRSNGDPATGNIHHQSGGGEMRIHHFDFGGTDRKTALEALVPGDQVEAGGIDWDITSISLQTDHIRIGVIPTSRAANGEQTITFTTFTASAIDYVHITDHYVSNSAIRGFKSLGAYDDLTLDDDAYGVDIQIQNAVISPDWDPVFLPTG